MNWENCATTASGPSMEELVKLMKAAGPPPKRMFLIAEDPFQFKPFEMPILSPVWDDDPKERLTNFKVMANYGFSLKTPNHVGILHTCDVGPAVPLTVPPNIAIRVAALVAAVLLFMLIWSAK